MKRIILMSLFLCTLLWAQTYDWGPDGVPVATGHNIIWNGTALSTSDNGMVYVWSDTRTGPRRLLATKIMADGSHPWGDDPVNISNREGAQKDPFALVDENDNIIIVWITYDSMYNGTICAQKLDAGGSAQWGDEGIVLHMNNEHYVYDLKLLHTAQDTYTVLWLDSYLDMIFLNEFHSDGTVTGGNGTGIYGEITSTIFTACPDGTGGFLLAFQRDSQDQLYLSRNNSENDWEISLPSTDGRHINLVPLADSLIALGWRVHGANTSYDVLANVLDLDGAFVLNEPLVLLNCESQPEVDLTAASDGGFFVACTYAAIDGFYQDIMMQKVSNTCTPLWGDNGVMVCDELYHQRDVTMLAGPDGDVYIAWQDDRVEGYENSDIYMQHLQSNGTAAWQDSGQPICTLARAQHFADLCWLGNDIHVVWADNAIPEGDRMVPYSNARQVRRQILTTAGQELLEHQGEVILEGRMMIVRNLEVLTNDNASYAVWSCYEDGVSFIRAQKVQEDGTREWGLIGKQLTASMPAIRNFDVIPFHLGGIIVAWELEDANEHSIHLMAVGSDGNIVWDDLQVFTTNDWDLSSVRIGASGDAYTVAWSQLEQSGPWSYAYNVFAQRVENGQPVWDEPVRVIQSEYDSMASAVLDSYIVAECGRELRVARIDEEGTPYSGFEEPLCMQFVSYVYDETAAKHGDDLVLFWRYSENNQQNIYTQIVHPNGTMEWEGNGLPLFTDTSEHYDHAVVLKDDHFYVSCISYNYLINDYPIVILQKFNYSGQPMWGEEPLTLFSGDYGAYEPVLVDAQSGVLCGWSQDSTTNYHIRAQYITGSGTQQWAEGGVPLVQTDQSQTDLAATASGSDHVVLMWVDYHGPYGDDTNVMFGQRMETSVVSAESDTPAPVLHLAQNTPNPFNPETSISFSLAQPGNVKLEIFNIRGQHVCTLLQTELNEGEHSVVWRGQNDHGKPAGSGVYMYRLQSGGTSQTRRMLLLK